MEISSREAREGETGSREGARSTNRARNEGQQITLGQVKNSEQSREHKSSIKQVQRLLGIKTESETPAHKKLPACAEQTSLLHEAGVLIGERMVKLVEYHVLLNTQPAEAFKALDALNNQLELLNTAISACNRITDHVLAPILTKGQREYIEKNKEAVKTEGDRTELQECLERAIISETIEPSHSTAEPLTHELEKKVTQEAAKEIESLLLPLL
ncbi:MAG TPA: hypothetical protein VGB17_13935 [Pyrinomonadaceae bacterium]|jgi:hypothetical protein